MSAGKPPKDRIFAAEMLPGDFVFDEKVAKVFEDMINRSVPGYNTIIAMIGVLSERYCRRSTTIYDLGCSLGGATFAAIYQVTCPDYSVVAVDNSPAMIVRLESKLAAAARPTGHVQCRCEDILQTDISNASIVILNFTLQFIPLAQRQLLLQKIYNGLNAGGILIVSEKILFPDAVLNQLFIDLYHRFKESRGYSQLEISQKRAALENILIPETIASHRSRLNEIGFHSFDVWFQCFNFASMVAIK
jgi:tRNA (cmo5U34)-methyltransferase